MKTSALVPIVAYLGLAGLSSAAPLPGSESEVALDKRTFCFFGFGFGCNSNTPATTSSAAAKSTAASSAVTSSAAKSSAVTISSAVKSSAAVSSAAAAKASSVAPVASSAKAAVSSANAAVTKTGTAAWAQCTDFDWSAWDDKKVSWGGFNKQYVQDWYLAEYGLAPPPGMNWRQVSSLVNKFAVQTPATGPKTTSKATKGCSNPWTSAAPATKTKAVTITTAKPVTPSTTPVKPATTSAAAQSSAAGNKSSASGAASSSPSSVKPIASSAAASASSAAAGKPSASSAAGPASSAAAPASSAAGPASSAAAPASSAVVPPVVEAPAQSSTAAPAQSSAAATSPSPAASSASPSPAAPSPSADASSGQPGVGSGLPGTGAGLPGSGNGDNNGTATVVPEPEATEVAPITVNGYTYGGCAQEVAGRLLDKVQTQSSSQTIESCTALCASYGFAVSGLEYGSECYCGTLDDIEDAELSGECKMPCSGNADQLCGGPNAINWYYDADKIAPTVELPAGWTTYGVVSEGTNGARLMSTLLYASNDNTIEKCAAGCAAAGYKVAGTEYSSECFCSNGFLASSGGGQLLDDSAAFMKCSGNLAQSCGGPSILSVTSAFGDNIPFI